MKTLLALLLVVPIFLISCATENSEDVNQDRIQTNYSLEVDKTSNRTTARAKFSFGSGLGTSLVLTEPAYVEFLGQELRLTNNPLTGTSYELVLQGTTERGVMTYVDLENRRFNNTLVTPSAIDFSNGFSSFSKSRDLIIGFTGAAIGSGESLDLIIDERLINYQTISTNELRVAQADLADLRTGRMEIRLVRSVSRDLEEGTEVGGRIHESYVVSKTVEVSE